MITPYDVYVSHKQAESQIKSKGYRLPKDWDSYFSNKISPSNQQIIQTTADYFNTKWQDIDIFEYMLCGFELFKNFGFKDLLNPKIIEKYIRKDKKIKLNSNKINKKDLIESLKYVKNNYDGLSFHNRLLYYGTDKEQVIKDYLTNKICISLLTWMIRDRYIKIEEADMSRIGYVSRNYKKLVTQLEENRSLLRKIKEN